jgi:DNA primase
MEKEFAALKRRLKSLAHKCVFVEVKGVVSFLSMFERLETWQEWNEIVFSSEDEEQYFGLDINNIQDRINFTKGFSEILKDVESNVEVDAYINKYSKIMQVNENAIYAELNRLREKNKIGNNKHNIVNGKKTEPQLKKGEIIAEIYLLNICIYYFEKAKNIFELIQPVDFSSGLHSRLAEIIKNKADGGKPVTAGEIIGFFESDEEKTKIADIFGYQLPDMDVDRLIKSSVDKVKQSRQDRRIQDLTDKMNELYQAGDKSEANKIFVEIQELQKKKR